MAREADVVLAARGGLQGRVQRPALLVGQREPGCPRAQFAAERESGPVQRAVVAPAQVTGGGSSALGAVDGAPPQRRGVAGHRSLGLCVAVGALEGTLEARGERVESAAPQDLPRGGPIEALFLDGRRRGGAGGVRRGRRGGQRGSREDEQERHAAEAEPGVAGSRCVTWVLSGQRLVAVSRHRRRRCQRARTVQARGEGDGARRTHAEYPRGDAGSARGPFRPPPLGSPPRPRAGAGDARRAPTGLYAAIMQPSAPSSPSGSARPGPVVDPARRGLLTERIARELEHDIRSGQIAVGTKLPPNGSSPPSSAPAGTSCARCCGGWRPSI